MLQIIEFGHHRVSFVQVRGSIPVYWSQTGVKYRPPPKLDKGRRACWDTVNQFILHVFHFHKPYSPYLHYRLVFSLERIDYGNTGNKNHPDLKVLVTCISNIVFL